MVSWMKPTRNMPILRSCLKSFPNKESNHDAPAPWFFVAHFQALCKKCTVLFSCRLSSFGKSAGLQNRKREVRCLQTVPRSGWCVTRPRPNTDSEQCIKTVVTPNERSFHHETRIGNIHDNHHFILKWVAKWVRTNEKHPETYVSRCYFLVGAGGCREPRI